jgi:hypothetical protein
MAATIVDKLILQLGFDVEDYKKGKKEVDEGQKRMRETSEKTRKAWEDDGRKVVSAFNSIKREVLAVGAAFGLAFGVSAIRNFAESIITGDAAVGRLAKNLGMSTEELSRWEGMAGKLGSSSSGANAAFRNLVRMSQEIKNIGSLSDAEHTALGRAGVNMNIFASTTARAEDKMLELVRAFSLLTPADAQQWGQMAGFSEDWITVLTQGIEVQKELARQTNIVRDANVKAAIDMDQRIKRIQDGFRNIGRALVDTLGPTVLKLAEEFQHWLATPANLQGLVQGFRDLAKWINSIDWHAVGEGIKSFAREANVIAQALGGWLRVSEILFGLWVAGKVAPMIIAIGMVARALGVLGAASAGGLAGLLGALAFSLVPETDPERAKKDLKAGNFWTAATMDVPAKEGLRMIYDRLQDWGASQRAEHDARMAASVSIGNITVVTQATDAAGVARGLKTEITKQLSTVTQSGNGMR